MQRYVIVTFLEAVDDGFEFNPQNYPLHVTIIPSFRLNSFAPELENEIATLCSKILAIKTEAEGDEYFGPSKEVHVSTIRMRDDLMKLHTDLKNILAAHHAEFDEPHYMAENYRAHATVQEKKRLNVGDPVIIDRVSVIDKFPNGNPNIRRVLKTIKLSYN